MTIAINPDAPVATLTACHVVVTGQEDRRPPDETGGAFEYYVECTSDDWDGKPLRSHRFNVSKDGEHRAFDGLVFPSAGTWDVALIDAADDSEVESIELEVS